jgi:hypothetical protein
MSGMTTVFSAAKNDFPDQQFLIVRFGDTNPRSRRRSSSLASMTARSGRRIMAFDPASPPITPSTP